MKTNKLIVTAIVVLFVVCVSQAVIQVRQIASAVQAHWQNIAPPINLSAVATTNATSVEQERQYWQDELIQLSHAWRTRFAHQDPNNVQLAYQSVKVIKAIQAQAGAIGVLRQQVVDLAKGNIVLQDEVAELSKRLKAHTDQPATIDGDKVDPNEVKE